MNTKNTIRSMAVVAVSAVTLLGAMPLIALADNPVPSITSISPSTVANGGGAFTLTVYGNNFVVGSTVNVNGSGRLTSYVSSGQLTATINAPDVASAGSSNITVTNPAPGGGTSNALTLVATGNFPVPTLTSISPSSRVAGGGSFVMTLNGNNFVPSSYVTFNGMARATTFVSANQVTAFIPAGDVAMTGIQAVNVVNPVPGGGTSNAILFTIDPVSTTPSLPNTGFGPPSVQTSAQNVGLVALGVTAIGILTLALVARKRLWLTK